MHCVCACEWGISDLNGDDNDDVVVGKLVMYIVKLKIAGGKKRDTHTTTKWVWRYLCICIGSCIV